MPAIKHYLEIPATPEDIYRALTTRDGLAGWWTRESTSGDAVGASNTFRFGERFFNRMKITKLEENRRVEWECAEGEDEWIGTTLTFDLEPGAERTTLRFTHDKWREETDFFASCNYNWGYYLQSLRHYTETGIGTPFDDSK